MKHARISLARLMAIVAVVAVNCAMIATGFIDFVLLAVVPVNSRSGYSVWCVAGVGCGRSGWDLKWSAGLGLWHTTPCTGPCFGIF